MSAKNERRAAPRRPHHSPPMVPLKVIAKTKQPLPNGTPRRITWQKITAWIREKCIMPRSVKESTEAPQIPSVATMASQRSAAAESKTAKATDQKQRQSSRLHTAKRPSNSRKKLDSRPVLVTPKGKISTVEYQVLAESPDKLAIIKTFYYQGSESHNYEDRFAVNEALMRVALADGATQGCRSHILAEELVQGFVSNPSPDITDSSSRDRWWLTARKNWYSKVLPVYESMRAEEQARYERGGAATFMGFWMPTPFSYQLCWIGDCCAFWFSATENLVSYYPTVIEFGSRPLLLNTNDSAQSQGLTENTITVTPPMALEGTWLVLASDAISAYLLEKQPWKMTPNFWKEWISKNNSDFVNWMTELRDSDMIVSDDYSTLAILMRYNRRFAVGRSA